MSVLIATFLLSTILAIGGHNPPSLVIRWLPATSGNAGRTDDSTALPNVRSYLRCSNDILANPPLRMQLFAQDNAHVT